MLKPGGTLGIEDHRLPESASTDREKTSGYIKVSTVRRLAEQAGFRFVAASDVNANKKDTADWPKGVWTLPPTRVSAPRENNTRDRATPLTDAERAAYDAIGESDRMTLRFRKPGA